MLFSRRIDSIQRYGLVVRDLVAHGRTWQSRPQGQQSGVAKGCSDGARRSMLPA